LPAYGPWFLQRCATLGHGLKACPARAFIGFI
jgi:hypothetical protein